MLIRFLLTLMSSWIVNPMGVLVAQWFGVANSPTIILALLASSACVPFQLLLNECMATIASRGSASPTRIQVNILLLVQTLACIWAIIILSAQKFPHIQSVFTILLLILNTFFSYRVSIMFYSVVGIDGITKKAAFIVGAIPGITSLFCYFLYCLFTRKFTHIAWVIMLASLLIPTIAQWFFVRDLYKNSLVLKVKESKLLPQLSMRWFIVSIISLAFLTTISTHLREIIATSNASFVALLLVALNSLLSIINTSTRAAFLSGSGSRHRKALFVGVLLALALSALGVLMQWKFIEVFFLLATQAAIAYVIELARHMPILIAKKSVDSFAK